MPGKGLKIIAKDIETINKFIKTRYKNVLKKLTHSWY
jgi:hypothetical protein